MTKHQTFYIEIADGANLDLDEIWPDGDAPEDPTVDDVIEKILSEHISASRFATDWGFQLSIFVDGKQVPM